jgi:hypothetical protein
MFAAGWRVVILILLASILFAQAAVAGVVIQSRIDEGPWRAVSTVCPLKGQTVTLRVAERPGALVRWYRIKPDLSTNYQNANQPWETDPYQWTGYAKIRYSREELTELRGKWEVEPLRVIGRVGLGERIRNYLGRLSRRLGGPQYQYRDVGSFWFQVEVESDGRVERSPGIEDSDEKGLSPSVLRVSVRDGEGYLGYVSSFLNVPGLFGSTVYQSTNYIGVDCADVLVAAHGEWSGRAVERNYNVAMLVDELPRVAEFEVSGGTPGEEVKWGSDVRTGDLIAVKYRGWGQFGHIGALHSDANGNGVLDKWDLVIHAGPTPLHVSPLRWGGFDGRVVVLRFAGTQQ